MRETIKSAVVAALVGGAAAILAASGQTPRPGDMARPDVWVRNTASEPIPVKLDPRSTDLPLRVVVANGEGQAALPLRVVVANGEGQATLPLRVRVSAPVWEYRSVTVKTADDPANALAVLGAEGWEVTGLEWSAPDGKKLLMKRAR